MVHFGIVPNVIVAARGQHQLPERLYGFVGSENTLVNDHLCEQMAEIATCSAQLFQRFRDSQTYSFGLIGRLN
jgi:hypothetical protein